MDATILTERLCIQRLAKGDAETVFMYRSDPEISRFQNWEPRSLSEVENFIASQEGIELDTPGKWYQLGIYDRNNGELVGDCGIHVQQENNHQAEIGITLRKEFHGKGLATEALKAILDYLFNTMNKHRVFGSVDPRNKASIALLERVGMRHEAHFVESLWFKDAWVDDVIYAILKREYVKE